MKYLFKTAALLTVSFLFSCQKKTMSPINGNAEKKEFTTSFESINDFAGFYLTPQAHQNTTYHELSDSIVHSGIYAHKAWITGTNPASAPGVNNNHRGYPTIQFQHTNEGVLKTPCYVTFWVWLDMDLQKHSTGENDWFSFATFTDDESDHWRRTVLVNLNTDGFVHLQHTANQGQQSIIFQTTDLTFPQKEWVELKIYLDFRSNGYAKVWQNGQLVTHANIDNIDNKLSQAHFGLYCPPQMTAGLVYNDDLSIREVNEE